jgi:hypothetical protein
MEKPSQAQPTSAKPSTHHFLQGLTLQNRLAAPTVVSPTWSPTPYPCPCRHSSPQANLASLSYPITFFCRSRIVINPPQSPPFIRRAPLFRFGTYSL